MDRLSLKEPTREELDAARTGGESHLPKARVNKKDSVCKFCGVSYLVFSEVRALERQLQQAKEELEAHKRNQKHQDAKNQQDCVTERREEEQKEEEERQVLTKDEHMKLVASILAKEHIKHEQALEKEQKNGKEMLRSLKVTLESRITKMERDHKLALNRVTTKQQSWRSQVQSLQKQLDAVRKAHKVTKEQSTYFINNAREQAEESIVAVTKAFENQLRLEKENLASRLYEFEARARAKENDFVVKGNQLSDEVAQLQDANHHLREECNSLTKQLNEWQLDKQNKIKQRCRDIELVESAFRMAEQDWKDRVSHLEELVRKKCDAMDGLGQKYRASLESISANAREWKRRFCDQEKLTQESNQARSHVELENESMRQQIVKHSHVISELRKTLEKESETHSLAKEKIGVMEQDLRTTLDRKIAAETAVSRLEAQLARVMNEMSAEGSQKDTVLEQLQQVKQVLEKQNQALLKELNEGCFERKTLQGEVKELRSQVEMQKVSLKSMSQRLSEAELELHRLETERKDKANQVDSLRQQLESNQLQTVAAFQQRESEMQDRLKELESALGDKQDLLGKKELQLSELGSRLQEMELSNRSKQDEIRHLKMMVEDTQGQLEAALASNGNQTSEKNNAPQLEEGIEILERHMIKLSDLVRQKDSEIKILQATVHRQCLERTDLLRQVKECKLQQQN